MMSIIAQGPDLEWHIDRFIAYKAEHF